VAAEVHAHARRPDEAAREARQALALDPGNAAALSLLRQLETEP
jgi:hypothetical protein